MIYYSLFLIASAASVENDALSQIYLGRARSEVIITKINVSNLRRSVEFYTKAFDMKEVINSGAPQSSLDDTNTPFREVCLNFSRSTRDHFLCLVSQKGIVPSPEAVQIVTIGIKVSDLEQTRSSIQVLGARIGKSSVYKGVRIAFAYDPDGYCLELLQAPEAK